MGEIHTPDAGISPEDRLIRCRYEMEAAMLKLIAAATKLGWTEIEVTMALADASEDHVLRLAQRRADPVINENMM